MHYVYGKKNKLNTAADRLACGELLPKIKEYFASEEGKAEYQKYLDEKAGLANHAEVNDNDDNADSGNGKGAA